MTQFMVQLTCVSAIKRFVNIACAQDFDILVMSGRYAVDAKSIMGVFSLDLSKPLRIEIECDKTECADFAKAIEEFIFDDTLQK